MGTREWPLVGRARELERLAAAIGRDDLSGILLAGPAGVGKTRLATECASMAAETGFGCKRVLATRAASVLPLGALGPLLPVAERSAEVRSDLLPWAVAALKPGDERLLLVVDDAHLLDDTSASVVHQLAQRAGTFIVMSVRSGEPAPDPVRSLWKETLVERLDLQPLARDDVDQLLDAVLGSVIDGLTRQDLWEASQGNPLFLHEMVLGAIDAGILRHEDGVWRLTHGLASTARLVELVEARLVDLQPEERTVLELLALGEPLDLVMLERLGIATEMLGRLEARGLVQLVVEGRSPRLRLAHSLHGDVLRHRMTAIARLITSRRLADAVDLDRATADEVLRLAVWRLEGGGDVDAGTMIAAARRSFFAHDMVLAERLARAAIHAGGGFPAGLLLAQTLGARNQHEDRHALLRDLQHEAGTDEQRAMVAMERALTLFWGLGRGDEAERVLRDAAASLPDGANRQEVIAQVATLELLMGRFDEALAIGEPILASDPGTRAAVTAAIAVAPALAVSGRCDEALAVAEGALATHMSLGNQEVMSELGIHVVARALALGEAGRLSEAYATAVAGYDMSVANRIADGQAWFALIQGRLDLAAGRLTSAAAWFREGAAVYGQLGQHGPRRWCLAGRVIAAAQQGDRAEAATALVDLDGFAATPMLMMEPDVLRARAWEAWVRGYPTEAVDRLHEAIRSAEAAGAGALAIQAWHDLARLGQHAEARAPLEDWAGKVDGDLAQVRAAHVAALSTGDADGLADASTRFEALGANLLAAEAAAAASSAYRRGQDRRMAERWAQTAAALAERCEGAATPALVMAGRAATLTAREAEIAGLAATGLSSKEIASRLGVSARTVESHLQGAYVKLGVSRRDELAEALRGAVP